jgi:hypothetical protein
MTIISKFVFVVRDGNGEQISPSFGDWRSGEFETLDEATEWFNQLQRCNEYNELNLYKIRDDRDDDEDLIGMFCPELIYSYSKYECAVCEKRLDDNTIKLSNCGQIWCKKCADERTCEVCETCDESVKLYETSNQYWCETCAEQVPCPVCGCWYFKEDGDICSGCQKPWLN